jgi:alpha-tubulin suppressor-like RCC1 family protein
MVLTDTQNIYQSVAVDATGTVFFDQMYGAGVGKVGATGAKEWIGGASALGGYADGLGRNAAFGAGGGRANAQSPDLVVGDDGAVYMVDAGNNVIRKGTPISVTSALPEFTQSPVHTSTLASEAVTFTAKASVADATLAPLQYAWQYLAPNGTTWVDVPYYDLQRAGATPGTVSLTLPPQSWLMRNGTQYRCVVTDAAYRTVTSNAATLAVTAQPGILWTSQSPYNVTPAALAADVFQVAIGANHTMILKKDGTLWGMGNNHQGQLGDGTTTDRPDPVRVDTEVAQVTTASDHTLYVKKDGSLWAVGDNMNCVRGIGSAEISIATPVKIAEGVQEVYTSFVHSIFLKADGTLWTMGTGILGDGTPDSTKLSPVQIASQVDSCAIDMWSTAYTSGGTLYAVGNTVWASMVRNYTTGSWLSMGMGELLPVPIRTGVQRLLPMRGRAGYAAGFVYLGDGPSGVGTYYVPVQWWFSKDYGVSTWDNVAGHPVQQLSAKTDFSLVGLYGGKNFLFLLDGNGDLYAQGLEGGAALGQFTDGTPQAHLTLDLVHRGVVDFSTNGGTTQFVTNDGMLWTAGGSLNGSLTMNRQMSDVVSACGGTSRFYLKADGTLWAMGQNNSGQLGDGTTEYRSSPVKVATGVTAVAAGSSHSLFIKSDGTLWAMGDNNDGQLGDQTPGYHSSPVEVATGVTAVAAGGTHSLFIKSDGTLWAMGRNSSGQLGDGTTEYRSSPVEVATGVTAVAAGSSHSLFIKSDGTLWAMGDNRDGQLGDGSTTGRSSPVQVVWGATAVAAGGTHSLFIKSDGTLWAMGDNRYGQLGDGTTTGRSRPVQVEIGRASCRERVY